MTPEHKEIKRLTNAVKDPQLPMDLRIDLAHVLLRWLQNVANR